MLREKCKLKIKLILRKYPQIFDFFRYLYTCIFKRSRLEQKKKYGNKNQNDVIYLIRPTSEDSVQGLLSLFSQTMEKIAYAEENKYIPYVDFKNYRTQYYNGRDNIWEQLFSQTSNLTEKEVYNSKNVILSGIRFKDQYKTKFVARDVFFSENVTNKLNKLINKYVNFNKEIEQMVSKEVRDLKIEECIGVYVRGTDYVKLKPPGEYVQPDVGQMIPVIEKFREKHNKKIFLVTEDYDIYMQFKKKYGEDIKIVSYDKFIKNYEGKDYISKSNVLNGTPYDNAIDYLVKMIVLSKCKYLVTSITMGSMFTYALGYNSFEDKYVFDLGVYQ